MSLRPAPTQVFGPRRAGNSISDVLSLSAQAAPGSLFGAPVCAASTTTTKEQLWTPMAISPPRSPVLPELQSRLEPPTFYLNADSVNLEPCLSTEPLVEAVCPTWECEMDGAALIRFAQEQNSSAIITGKGGKRVRNTDFVVAKPIVADAVVWRLMRDIDNEACGSCFFLMSQGAVVSKIEVMQSDSGSSEIGRVAIVDPMHTKLAVASGLADSSTLLEFQIPADHVRQLRALRAHMRADAGVGYIPTREVVVGRALDALPLKTSPGPGAAAAPSTWAKTKRFLHELSEVTVDAMQTHTEAEMTRAGALEAFRELVSGWKEYIA